ncbi:MAG: hypothetical protein H7Y41_06885 [Hyphomonadaceae bacterium]|nr:hypothetical protein [Clostridia bacterium]
MGYFLVQLKEETKLFFYDKVYGICMRDIIDNHLSETETLVKDGQRDFDVLIDCDGQLHLLCQDQHGDIFYLKKQGMQYAKHHLLTSKEQKYVEKYFRMVETGQMLNLFYVLPSQEGHILVHQMIGNSILSPEVVDYISEDRLLFDVVVDAFQNIYMLYSSKSGLNLRVYKWSTKQWSEPQEIVATSHRFPLLMMHGEKIYYSYVEDAKKTIYIGEINGEKKGIQTPFMPTQRPILSMENGVQVLSWLYENNIFTYANIKDNTAPQRLQLFGSLAQRIHYCLSEKIEGFGTNACFGQLTKSSLKLYNRHIDILAHIKHKKQAAMPIPVAPRAQVSETPSERPQVPDFTIEKLKIQMRMMQEEIEQLKHTIGALQIKENKEIAKIMVLPESQETFRQHPLEDDELAQTVNEDEVQADLPPSENDQADASDSSC